MPPNVLNDFGITELQFFSCPNCWGNDYGSLPVDATVLAEDLAENWVPAMEHAQDLADAATTLTALTSSMSADEMVSDPLFVLNPDMGEVSNQHNATLVTLCGNRVWSWEEAPRVLRLEDGRELKLPADYLFDPEFDLDDWLGEMADYPAESVQQTGRSGGAVTITDNREAIDALLSDLNTWSPTGCGGGCNQGGVGGFGVLLFAGLGLARRRRDV